MEKKRLLLVDDDQGTRELIEEFMQYDCDCISTQNGVEGFSYLERNPGQIDLIVMDLVMSVMDGFELIRRAQEHPLNKNIPILVIGSSGGYQEGVYAWCGRCYLETAGGGHREETCE